jgi:serine/threonine protein phosphatase PrpC
MSAQKRRFEWGVLGHSQAGASHVRNGLPNQDAFLSLQSEDGAIIAAVADGHGSPKSFRSDVGAKFAVESAVEVCQEFLKRFKEANLSDARNRIEQLLAKRITQDWEGRVDKHLKENPIPETKFELLPEAKRPHLAYGSTLLVAFVNERFLAALQIGDGDIVAVSDDSGEVTYAIPKDPSLIANETTSLSQEDAHKHFRFCFHVFESRPPALLLLSTDGYANSFATPNGYLQAGTDLLSMLLKEGPSLLDVNLPEWLEEASRDGSGDDVTVGIIYRKQPAIKETQSPISATESNKINKT